MPGPYGLLPTGFVPKPLVDIKQELDEKYKAAYGTSVGSAPDGSIPPEKAMGQQIGILSEREALLWEMGQAVNSSTDPDKAEGTALDAVCALTGTLRMAERQSIAVLSMTGDPMTLLPIGRVVSVVGANTRFDTTSATTLAAATAWTGSTAFIVGDRVSNGVTVRVYHCIGAGVSDVTGGPSTTAASIGDGSVLWQYVGDGSAVADVVAVAELAGPFAALSGTLTKIETPVNGWKSAINLLDAAVGDFEETDAALRVRRENELQGGADSTLDAVRAKILKVGENTPTPVTACVVFENTTMFTDADGLPPKSIEALVLGGQDQDIWDAVLASKAGGIESYGNTVGSANDSYGNAHVTKFSRPVEILIWIEVDVKKYPPQFPLDGMTQIIAVIVNKMSKWGFGQDVNAWQIGSPIEHVAGVLEVLAVRLGLAPAPGGSGPITITTRQIARFDSSRVLVNLSDGTP